MLIEPSKLIFIHIQKTGGSAIRKALGRDTHSVDHRLASEQLAAYGQEKWDACYKFAFVRNPWDRLVSWWSMIDASRSAYQQGLIDAINPRFISTDKDGAKQVKGFFQHVIKHANTFDEFLDNCSGEIVDPDGPKNIFRSQSSYITDRSGNVIVDFVGRFERLQADFDVVCLKVGLSSRGLDRVNRSKHNHYTDYYSPRHVKVVADAFAEDISRFGYRFGD